MQRTMRSVLRSVGALLGACALAACSHAAFESARPEPASTTPEREQQRAEREAPSAPEESGAETPEEPAVDAATLARGRTLVAPGKDGFLTTWQLLETSNGPLPPEQEAALGTPCDDCDPPRVIASDDLRIDVGDAVNGSARTAYLGATLLVPRDTRLHLLVGMRGGGTVFLDGQPVVAGLSEDRFRRDLLLGDLALSEGEHRLVVRFDRPEQGEWRGSVRFLSAGFAPGAGNVAITVGELPEEQAVALAAQAVRFDELHELGAEGPVVRVRAYAPGGAVRRSIPVRIGESEATLEPEGGVFASAHELVVPMPERGMLRIEGATFDRAVQLGGGLSSDRQALRAAAELRALLDTAPEDARAPIAWRMSELVRAVREHDGDQAWRNTLAADARRIARSLERDRDPFADLHGYERMAFFSKLDGTPQEYELFVPPAYRRSASREWPLVITLHGYKGNAGDFFRNTFGLARDWENGETLVGHGRHGAAPTSGPMFVIAPTGRGQAYYRQAGEVDVMEALEDVRARFPHIDPDRIYITGGSMGGTGAAYLPYRHPDLFAASAALAGYHDQRVREDTDHDALSPVEHFLEAHRSDIDWAENGLYLPTLLVRGTQDRPLEWTRCLVRRLNDLGYSCEHREPESGHNVWTETYADGAIFQWFARYRRPEHPAHVRLRTARERTREAWWVRVDQRSAPDRFASVDAQIDHGVITATIEGADAVTFSPAPPLVEEGAPIRARIGEQTIEGPAPLTIERTDEGWRAATETYPRPGARRPGLDGPIRDVFREPLTFVVGTQDPRHTFVNRLVARRWSHPKGWVVDYPIVDDVDVTDAMIRDTVLVLVGPPSSNSVLARIADRLPIRVANDGVHVGDAVHRGAQVGAAFVAPNPLNPDRMVLVIAGPEPLGTWRSIALPDILPDYVVWDERIASARDRWACGGTGCEYLAHGFFDMRWQLPD